MTDLIVPIDQLQMVLADFRRHAGETFGESTSAKNEIISIKAAIEVSLESRNTFTNELNNNKQILIQQLDQLMARENQLTNQINAAHNTLGNPELTSEHDALQRNLNNLTSLNHLLNRDIHDHQVMIAHIDRILIKNDTIIGKELFIYSQVGSLEEKQQELNNILYIKMILGNSIGEFVDAIRMVDKNSALKNNLDILFSTQVFEHFKTIESLTNSETKIFEYGVPLFADGINMNDIDQMQLGDCWLIALLAGLAKNNPDAISDAIVVLSPGLYMVRFFDKEGSLSYVPVTEDDIRFNELPSGEVYHSSTASELWVAVLEVAFSFSKNVMLNNPFGAINDEDNLKGGSSDDTAAIYHALTGNEANIVDISAVNATDKYNLLNALVQGGKTVTVPIHSDTLPDSAVAPEWYLDKHVYAVVGTDNGMIQIRNPWGDSAPGADPNGIFNVTPDEFNTLFGHELVVGG
jgi:hypothetical protein